MRAGEVMIVDAAFLRRHERLSCIELARELGVPVHIVHCHAPGAELRARLRQRQGDASEATEDVLTQQLGYWESFDATEIEHVIELDTTTGHRRPSLASPTDTPRYGECTREYAQCYCTRQHAIRRGEPLPAARLRLPIEAAVCAGIDVAFVIEIGAGILRHPLRRDLPVVTALGQHAIHHAWNDFVGVDRFDSRPTHE